MGRTPIRAARHQREYQIGDMMEHEDKTTYTTSRNYKIKFNAIPTLLQKVSQSHKLPTPPTYTPPTVEGFASTPVAHHHKIIQVNETDENGVETSVLVDKVDTSLETPEEFAAWAEYERALAAKSAEMVQAQLKLCLMEGITVLERPARDWEKRQRFVGIAIPDDPDEKEFHFLETEVAASAEDIFAILAGVSRASGVDEEAVSSLEDGFRSAMGQRGGLERANGHAPTDTALTPSHMEGGGAL